MFRSVYRRYGSLVHHEGAFLLEGTAEQTESRGFSFLVSRVASLRAASSRRQLRSRRRGWPPPPAPSCGPGGEAGGQDSVRNPLIRRLFVPLCDSPSNHRHKPPR